MRVRQQPSQIERRARNGCHSHSVESANFLWRKDIGTHPQPCWCVSIGPHDLGRRINVQPPRAVHRGCRHPGQYGVGSGEQPCRPGSQFRRQFDLVVQIHVAVHGAIARPQIVLCERAGTQGRGAQKGSGLPTAERAHQLFGHGASIDPATDKSVACPSDPRGDESGCLCHHARADVAGRQVIRPSRLPLVRAARVAHRIV